jgi:hypothetical protein
LTKAILADGQTPETNGTRLGLPPIRLHLCLHVLVTLGALIGIEPRTTNVTQETRGAVIRMRLTQIVFTFPALHHTLFTIDTETTVGGGIQVLFDEMALDTGDRRRGG